MSYSINDLKVVLGVTIVENKKLDKDQKLSLLEFVKNANDIQIKHLSLTGGVKEFFTEKEIKEINKNYNITKESNEIVMAIDIAKLFAMAVIAGVAAYKRYFSEAGKACRGTSGKDKTACIRKYKRVAREKEIAEFRKAMGRCSKTPDPSACKNKFKIKIQKLESKNV